MGKSKESSLPITEQRLLRAVRALQQVQRTVAPASELGKAIDKALRAVLPHQSRLQTEREAAAKDREVPVAASAKSNELYEIPGREVRRPDLELEYPDRVTD